MKFCPECGKRLSISGYCDQCQIQYGVGQGQGTRRQRAEFQIFKNFEFESLSDGGIFLKRCKNKNVDELVIPAEVSVLGEECFRDCTSLVSITFEGRMERISSGAFYGCTALEEIVWPQGLTEIGNYAFWHCSALEELEIPNGVVIVGREAFLGCTGLDSITLPPSLGRIETGAFEGCNDIADICISDLRSWCAVEFETAESSPLFAGGDLHLNDELITALKIPEDVYAIKAFAFLNCDLIESVYLSASVGSISPLAFYRCNGIEKITVDAANRTYRVVGGCCIVSGDNLVLASEEIEELPACVHNVCAGAFSACTDLCDLELPSSVTLSRGALLGLEGLDTLSVCITTHTLEALFRYERNGIVYGAVPEHFLELDLSGIKTLSVAQLRGCKKINTLKLAEGCTCLGNHALSAVEQIVSLHLPRSIASVGAVDATFNGIKKLVLAPGCALELREGCLIDPEKKELIASLQSVAVPKGIRRVAPYAFAGNKRLTSIRIGDSVRKIEEMAFASCPNLETVSFGESLIEIYCNIFCGCTSLRDIVFETSPGEWELIRRWGMELSPPHTDRGLSHWMRIFHPHRTEYERIVKKPK